VHWARTKIAELLDQRRTGENETEVRAAVIDLALTHHLMSPYTSLVAVDVTPVRRTDEDLLTHAIETNVPEGWDVSVLGVGATEAPRHVMLGLTALLLAAALAATARWRRRAA
jgi:Ca-activated chloride channel family protein